MEENISKQTNKILFTESEQNLLNYHRDHLKNNTFLENEDGSITTVYITGVLKDGKIYNIPGYVNGKKYEEEDQEELMEIAEENDWFNIYPSYELGPEDDLGLYANEAAEALHKVIENDGKKLIQNKK